MEVIDLQTIYPYDAETLIKSVQKTGRCIVTHEAPLTAGIGGEISAKLQEKCFLNLKAPITRVCGYDTPFPLAQELIYLPTEWKLYEKVKQLMSYWEELYSILFTFYIFSHPKRFNKFHKSNVN